MHTVAGAAITRERGILGGITNVLHLHKTR